MEQSRRVRYILGVLLAISFSYGCGITTQHFSLTPIGNSCQLTEARTALSTVARVDCWGEVAPGGSPTYLGAVGGMGVSSIQLPIEALKAAATLGAGYFIYRAGTAIGNATVDGAVSHTGTFKVIESKGGKKK